MGLNDEIGNFSKRREIEPVPKKYDDYEEDEYEYNDWDDEEENEYGSLDFKMYTLSDLERLNEEAQELEELIHPWWKNLKVIFTKSTFAKIGLLDYKKKYLLGNDTFEGVHISNVTHSLDLLKTFEVRLEKSYKRKLKSNFYSILIYGVLAYWTGWNFIWAFLIAWSLFDMISAYFKEKKHQAWLLKAEAYIKSENQFTIETQNNSTQIEDAMAFNSFVSQQEKEHWSIKLYDAVANLFKRKQ